LLFKAIVRGETPEPEVGGIQLVMAVPTPVALTRAKPPFLLWPPIKLKAPATYILFPSTATEFTEPLGLGFQPVIEPVEISKLAI